MARKEYVPELYDPIKLAYLAGIIDGEGCFTICKVHPAKYNRYEHPHYRGALQISNTKIELMQWLNNTFKNFNDSHKSYRRHIVKVHKVYDRVIYEWIVQNYRLLDVCKQVLPYLVIKNRQCALMIEFRETYTHWGVNTLAPEVIQKREELRLAMRALNAKTLFRSADHTD